MVIADPIPIFSVEFAACSSSPVPDSAMPTVRVLLFVRVTPVTVMLGIDNIPFRACGFVLNVCTPVPAVNAVIVPELVIPPCKVIASFAGLVQVPLAPTLIKPENSFVPVAEFIVIPPLVAPVPIEVVPLTASAVVNASNVRVPCVAVKFPVIVVVPVPVKVAPFTSSSSRLPKVFVVPEIA